MREDSESDTTHSNFKIKKQNKIPPNLPNNKLLSSLMFIFFASLAAYLHHTQRDQPFKPFVDTSSYYTESNPKIYAG